MKLRVREWKKCEVNFITVTHQQLPNFLDEKSASCLSEEPVSSDSLIILNLPVQRASLLELLLITWVFERGKGCSLKKDQKLRESLWFAIFTDFILYLGIVTTSDFLAPKEMYKLSEIWWDRQQKKLSSGLSVTVFWASFQFLLCCTAAKSHAIEFVPILGVKKFSLSTTPREFTVSQSQVHLFASFVEMGMNLLNSFLLIGTKALQ